MEIQTMMKSKGKGVQTFEDPVWGVIIQRRGSTFVKSCVICKTSRRYFCPIGLTTALKAQLFSVLEGSRIDCWCSSTNGDRCEFCLLPYPNEISFTERNGWGMWNSAFFCNQKCIDHWKAKRTETAEKERILWEEDLLLFS